MPIPPSLNIEDPSLLMSRTLEPETHPNLPSIALISPLLPWAIMVHASAINPVFVTMQMSFARFTEVEFEVLYPVVHAQEGMCHALGYCSCEVYQRDLIQLDLFGGKILRIVQKFNGGM